MTWHTTSLGVWAFLALLVVGVGVTTVMSKGRLATIGDFGRALMRNRLGGAVVLAIWMWLGWHFFAR